MYGRKWITAAKVLTHSLTRTCTFSFTYLLTHLKVLNIIQVQVLSWNAWVPYFLWYYYVTTSLTHSLLLTHPLTYLLTRSLTYLLTHLLTYLWIGFTIKDLIYTDKEALVKEGSITYSLTHSFTHSPTHSLTSPSNQVVQPLPHPSTRPLHQIPPIYHQKYQNKELILLFKNTIFFPAFVRM